MGSLALKEKSQPVRKLPRQTKLVRRRAVIRTKTRPHRGTVPSEKVRTRGGPTGGGESVAQQFRKFRREIFHGPHPEPYKSLAERLVLAMENALAPSYPASVFFPARSFCSFFYDRIGGRMLVYGRRGRPVGGLKALPTHGRSADNRAGGNFAKSRKTREYCESYGRGSSRETLVDAGGGRGAGSFSLPTTGCIQNSLYITLEPWPFALPTPSNPFPTILPAAPGPGPRPIRRYVPARSLLDKTTPFAPTPSPLLTYAWKATRRGGLITLADKMPRTKPGSCAPGSNSHSVNEVIERLQPPPLFSYSFYESAEDARLDSSPAAVTSRNEAEEGRWLDIATLNGRGASRFRRRTFGNVRFRLLSAPRWSPAVSGLETLPVR